MYTSYLLLSKTMHNLWRSITIHLVLFSICDFSFNAQDNVTLTSNASSSFQNDSMEEDVSVTLSTQLKPRMVTVCITPNDDSGHCMPLTNCSKLADQLANQSAKEFLRQSRCGPKNENKKNPFVCCGKYSNYKNLTCGHQNVKIRSRILGGQEAQIGEFPWLARLYHNKSGIKTFGCTGFLISTRFILTAAHCLKSKNVHSLGPVSEVHLGEHDTKTKIDCDMKKTVCADKKQVIKINKTFVHSSYDMEARDHHNDIGLIYLKKSAKISSFVSPICLLEHGKPEPSEYWLSGWGATETDSISNIKLKVSVPPFNHADCKKKFKKINVKINDKQLCAGGKTNKDSCTGDSGGPLMMVDRNRWFAAGVVSYGVGCGAEGWPGVYTNITHYQSWIKKTMAKVQKQT